MAEFVKRPGAEKKSDTLDTCVASCVSELMNAAVSMHKMHLKITGVGSYAGHKALNKLYDALPDHADALAEQFQGASEKLLGGEDMAPKSINSVGEALTYMREMAKTITDLQAKMPYSEIINDLDTIKSTLNSIKYKLLFLK